MKFIVERLVRAPIDRTWAVMADFGNTARWNTGLTGSRIVSGPEQGVGAERQCDFDGGFLRERITDWRDGAGYDLEFTRFPGPFRASASFHLESEGLGTRMTVRYWYQGRGIVRPFGWMVKPVLRKAIRTYCRDLAREAEA